MKNTTQKDVPDWDSVNWIQLKQGDVIQDGDWLDSCNNGWKDDPLWVPAINSIGEPAPDPSYPAHRIYRRII